VNLSVPVTEDSQEEMVLDGAPLIRD